MSMTDIQHAEPPTCWQLTPDPDRPGYCQCGRPIRTRLNNPRTGSLVTEHSDVPPVAVRLAQLNEQRRRGSPGPADPEEY